MMTQQQILESPKWIRFTIRETRCMLLTILIAACLGATQVQAQVQGYNITNLDSLGGTNSRGNSVNDRSWVAGYSNFPGNQSRHAALWRNGSILDLGTLGGPNSNVTWNVKNNRGIVVGIAQTATPDPLGEFWSSSAAPPVLNKEKTSMSVERLREGRSIQSPA